MYNLFKIYKPIRDPASQTPLEVKEFSQEVADIFKYLIVETTVVGFHLLYASDIAGHHEGMMMFHIDPQHFGHKAISILSLKLNETWCQCIA